MTLTDTHAHLDFPDFAEDLPAVLQRAAEAGVKRVINIGTHADGCAEILALSKKYPGVLFPVIGIHPTSVAEMADGDFDRIREMASLPGVAAIGETGLDYYRIHPKPDLAESALQALGASTTRSVEEELFTDSLKARQAEAFRAQLDLAAELKLNVVVHQREAWEDTLEILKDYTGQLRAVFHCFGGTPEQARLLIEMGHLISFTGVVTFKNATQVHETAASVPLDSFMVETDCPYLAPTPDRGKRCEPAHTRLVAEKIADLRGISLEEVAEATERTANAFFRLSPACA